MKATQLQELQDVVQVWLTTFYQIKLMFQIILQFQVNIKCKLFYHVPDNFAISINEFIFKCKYLKRI